MRYLKTSCNGVPENHQQATWHWLRLHGKSFAAPLQWHCHTKEWIDGNKRMSVQHLSGILVQKSRFINYIYFSMGIT